MPIGKMTPYIFYSYMDCVVAYLEMASHCMLLKANVLVDYSVRYKVMPNIGW